MSRDGDSDARPEETYRPRFAEVASFMRAALVDDPAEVDIAMVGVPFDLGVTNRAGARHGPRQVRDMSSFMRGGPHVSRIVPGELCRLGDLGDVPVNPFSIARSLEAIEAFFRRLHEAGAAPLSVGGDHLISLPILRAIAAGRPVGMVHFDAHCDTGDDYLGSKFHHGAPFRRAVEEGFLDPKRTIQIGIRGSLSDLDIWQFSHETGMRVVYIEE